MEKIIIILFGFYILFESFTAINEMSKVHFKTIVTDLLAPYSLKYLSIGLYAIWLLYFAESIEGWVTMLFITPVYFVIGRTVYRFEHRAYEPRR